MAINENTARAALHTCISMLTGGGKGVAMHSLGLIPKRYPAVIFDVHGEYKKLGTRKVFSYKTRRWFAEQFKKAWLSGKPFVLAYSPNIDAANEKERKKKLQEEAYWFGNLVWAAADGNRILYPVFEEYGEYADGNTADKTIIGKIFTGGRKFGLRAIAIFQRSVEVPKTIWNNSPRKVIGQQGGEIDIDRVMRELKCSYEDVSDLGRMNNKLSMYAEQIDETVRTKVHYLYSEASGTYEKVSAYVRQSAYLRADYSNEQKTLDKEKEYRLAA